MARLMESGKIEEVVFARFEPGEDILQALYEICREKDIRSGIILDGSGSAVDFTYQHFPINPKFVPTNVVIGTTLCNLEEGVDQNDVVDKMFPTIEGYLGNTEQKWHMIGSDAGHGTPYIHAHCVATNKDYTVCGHLMPGTKVASGDPKKPSHFTVIIAKISGVELQATIDKEIGFYQNVVVTEEKDS